MSLSKSMIVDGGKVHAVRFQLDSLAASLSGVCLGEETAASAERHGMTVADYMESDIDEQVSAPPDHPVQMSLGDLRELADRLDQLSLVLHVALGGEYYGEAIPEFGIPDGRWR